MTKLIVAFRNSANAPKKTCEHNLSQMFLYSSRSIFYVFNGNESVDIRYFTFRMSDLQEIFPGFMKLSHALIRTDGQCECNRRGEGVCRNELAG
jgi:hypothetical protein